MDVKMDVSIGELIVTCAACLSIGLLIGVASTKDITESDFKKQAIGHGFAQYNQIDGRFEWKTNFLNSCEMKE